MKYATGSAFRQALEEHIRDIQAEQNIPIFRQMRSQWGSCTANGKMLLNLKLIKVPKHFIDYIIVHELCHLIEHNHSQAFYALMSRIMPGWEEQRERLNAFEF